AGLRTAVINWWATWPAPDLAVATGGGTGEDTIVLTDRAVLRLERGGQLDAEIAPASVYERLRGRWGTITAAAERRAAESLPPVTGDGSLDMVLHRSAVLDALQLGLSEEVAAATTDLLA